VFQASGLCQPLLASNLGRASTYLTNKPLGPRAGRDAGEPHRLGDVRDPLHVPPALAAHPVNAGLQL